MASRKEKKAFAKKTALYLVGGGLGVVASKAVGDVLSSAGTNPNVLVPYVTASDLLVIVAELAGSYYIKKPTAKKVLVGMAAGSVATNVVKAVGTASWFALSYPYQPVLSYGQTQGRYGGRIGATALMSIPAGTYYPRR